ncbi:MAG: hypothetical protein ABR517_03030 [Thermoanaerobaculia bacterium]
MKTFVFPLALALLLGCSSAVQTDGRIDRMEPQMTDLDSIARQYVRLVLAMGLHDEDYVDAFYGPPEWRAQAKSEQLPLSRIAELASMLVADLTARPLPGDEMLALRHQYLTRQLRALVSRTDMLSGKKLSFDEQATALYDVEPPRKTEAEFQAILDQLDSVLPGEGDLSPRLAAFRKDFVIPTEKLDLVFRAAVDACRARTTRHLDLPHEESFRIEYVTGKSWSGYNWYQGDYKSLIQVNTDLPIQIDRAIDLACHEGYPGHHVYNVLLEKNLVNDRGWVENSVYALFSPQSLIAEGSANYGIDVAFPGDERVSYERDTLFPLAGLDPARAPEYYQVQDLIAKLNYAGNEAARRYLNGEITGEEAAAWLVRYGLYTPELAQRRVRFMDQYGAYVINYNLGKDLVRRHIEALGGGTDPERRWELFEELLSSPRLPSGLAR